MGFTEAFALELFEIRDDVRIAIGPPVCRISRRGRRYGRVSKPSSASTSTCWTTSICAITTSRASTTAFTGWSIESSPNRFINDFSDIITFIFHYHYQWNKADEKERNKAAIMEHLTYIEALAEPGPPQDRSQPAESICARRATHSCDRWRSDWAFEVDWQRTLVATLREGVLRHCPYVTSRSALVPKQTQFNVAVKSFGNALESISDGGG